MNKKEYKLLFQNAFKFLITDYNFKIISSKTDNWGIVIKAKNRTTGVKIIDEIREAYIQIVLYRLVDGEIVDNSSSVINATNINNDEPMLGFGLGWIIELKDPEAQLLPSYEYGEDSPFKDEENGKKNYVEFVAAKLIMYANDILNGDFSTFVALDKMVKEYFRDYYKMNNSS